MQQIPELSPRCTGSNVTEIPKIIHQMWKTDLVPKTLVPYTKTWKQLHRDSEWTYKMWTDLELDCLVASRYPQLIRLYDSYRLGLQRSDMARYVLMHAYGGVYADLDVEAIASFGPLLEGTNKDRCRVIFATEPQAHVDKAWPGKVVPCNAVLVSAPGHPFWERLFEVMELAKYKDRYAHDAVGSTGPGMLENLYRTTNGSFFSDVDILDPAVFYPIADTPDKLKPVDKNNISDQTYTIHRWIHGAA